MPTEYCILAHSVQSYKLFRAGHAEILNVATSDNVQHLNLQCTLIYKKRLPLEVKMAFQYHI